MSYYHNTKLNLPYKLTNKDIQLEPLNGSTCPIITDGMRWLLSNEDAGSKAFDRVLLSYSLLRQKFPEADRGHCLRTAIIWERRANAACRQS